jgi:hypothetical protein
MPFNRMYLYPIILSVFIGVVMWIQSVPYFESMEKTILYLISFLIFFSSFLLVVGMEE